MNLIPVLSTLITFVITGFIFQRFLRKGGIHLLIWSIGFLFYGLGTLTEVLLSITFNEWILKLWYLAGAMLTAAWLGQGTFYLLVRKTRIVNIFTIGLVTVSLLSLVLLFSSPLTAAAGSYVPSQPVSSQYKDILVRGALLTTLTIALNLYGTIILVGGALYSAYLFWRKQVMLNRVIGNLFIAAGALSPAMAGTFVKAGLIDGLYLSELVGVVLILVGFQFATAHSPAEKTANVQASG
jgi:hypothetical protein